PTGEPGSCSSGSGRCSHWNDESKDVPPVVPHLTDRIPGIRGRMGVMTSSENTPAPEHARSRTSEAVAARADREGRHEDTVKRHESERAARAAAQGAQQMRISESRAKAEGRA